MKTKVFGKVVVHECGWNGGKQEPTVSIYFNGNKPPKVEPEFGDQSIKLSEAKRLYTNLGKALAHIEKETTCP